jgi:adenylylsulfate kinase
MDRVIVGQRYAGGQVVWITGLSGAGKSTLGRALVDRFVEHGVPTIYLDGDELRSLFASGAIQEDPYSRELRLDLAMQYGQLCRLLSTQGVTVVIATISLFREVLEWNKKHLPNYFEIYLKVPLEELRRRDPKDIYKNFDSGITKNVAGLDLRVDEPLAPDWICGWPLQTPSTQATEIFDTILRRHNK